MRFAVIVALGLSSVVSAPSAQASSYDLKDSSILGQYALTKANSASEVQTAELVYNNENKLVIRTERNESEYELSGPDSNDVIFDEEGEPNCGGEEERCLFDARTTIRLVGATVNGKTVPQLSITITVSDAWIEDGSTDETTTYVLNWSKSLPYAIPFYLYAEVPADLKTLSANCKAKLETIKFDTETGYLNSNDICPYTTAFQYRDDFDVAFEYLKKDWVGSRSVLRELSRQEVKSLVFDRARALAAKYKTAGGITAQDIIAQLDLAEAYVLKADRVFAYEWGRHSQFFVVDTSTKTITYFSVVITRN